MKRIISIFLILVLCSGMLISCSAETSDPEPQISEVASQNLIEVAEADFLGGANRIIEISDNLTAVMDVYAQLLETVKEKRPEDYWLSEDYAFITFAGLDTEILSHYAYMNERTSFDDCINLVANTFRDANGNFVNSIRQFNAQRNNIHSYEVSYLTADTFPIIGKQDGARVKAVLEYDAGHDWLGAYGYFAKYNTEDWYNYQLCEYARLSKDGTDSRFAIQTNQERLYAVYDEAGVVKAFYYGQLDGENRNDVYPEYNENRMYVEQKGGWNWITYLEGNEYPNTLTNQYNTDDSMFSHLEDISGDWVMDSQNLRNVIIYEDGILTSRFYNRLSEKMEEAIIYPDGTVKKSSYGISATSGYAKEKNVLYVTTY